MAIGQKQLKGKQIDAELVTATPVYNVSVITGSLIFVSKGANLNPSGQQ